MVKRGTFSPHALIVFILIRVDSRDELVICQSCSAVSLCLSQNLTLGALVIAVTLQCTTCVCVCVYVCSHQFVSLPCVQIWMCVCTNPAILLVCVCMSLLIPMWACMCVFVLAMASGDRWSVKWIPYWPVCFGRSWKKPTDYTPRCVTHTHTCTNTHTHTSLFTVHCSSLSCLCVYVEGTRGRLGGGHTYLPSFNLLCFGRLCPHKDAHTHSLAHFEACERLDIS